MDNLREDAINAIAAMTPAAEGNVPEVAGLVEGYGSDVFGPEEMRALLPKQIYAALMKTVREGAAMDSGVADAVARAMKDWAIARGATHYTHWFQPLTGATAEKHQAFLDPAPEGRAILKFSGKNLIVGESDASSFPSGGLRSTFEARGYTAWDPSANAFLRRCGDTVTLCIPTAFCAYTGAALDRKTPLLRSIQAISGATERLMKAFGLSKRGARTEISLGAEQEYFLIDRRFYYSRPDLIQCGRTLFGAAPPKHQQLEDHYYGAIRPRILAFMSDVDRQMWRLGIPAKTRHNEVAPAQFEIAPTFEELNIAVDHNMLVMDILRLTAEKHGFVCLLHEKPFSGINGSGKHNNWSVSYGGLNLLDPGDDPHRNALFLTTLCAVISAVDKHADLLRATTVSAANDHRLGSCEAPPAIISIFLGEQLSDIIDQIEAGGAKSSRHGSTITLGIDSLPPLPKDATDRNRTSPFAFTGNKFEFRTPGSSQSCAAPNTVLNTIVAEAFDDMAKAISAFRKKEPFNKQLQKLLQKTIRAHKRVLFSGNGYDESWRKEAKKRGLPELANTPEALEVFKNSANIALFEKYGVFSESELHARYDIFLEEYASKVRIESELSLLLARTVIMPAASKELKELFLTIENAKSVPAALHSLKKTASRIAELLDAIDERSGDLEKLIAKQKPLAMVNAMAELRIVVDDLERILADSSWPLPKYREMLFIY